MRRINCLGAAAFAMMMTAGSHSLHAQMQGGFPQAGTTSNGRPIHPNNENPGSMPAATQEKMAEGRANERQKQLVAETDKLLELATALKADVDKTDKNMLSLDVVKRAEQIEKLARSVKERMKGQR
jgi:hypothetical protein